MITVIWSIIVLAAWKQNSAVKDGVRTVRVSGGFEGFEQTSEEYRLRYNAESVWYKGSTGKAPENAGRPGWKVY